MLTEWMDDAACLDVEDSEIFFDKYLQSEEIIEQVQNLCASCPVRIQCVNYGVYTKATGVWGGRWLQGGKIVKKLDLIVAQYFDKD